MAHARTVYRCSACGSAAPRWAGRCAVCGEWNSLVEEIDRPRHNHGAMARGIGPGGPEGLFSGLAEPPVALIELTGEAGEAVSTGIGELDRVLGGGLVPGSVTLLGGEPGIGKSTLVLQVLAAIARAGQRSLLVSAEESPAQVRRRAERLDALVPNVWIVTETTMAGTEAAVREIQPDIVVIDSIQTIWDEGVDAAPGSVVQVRGCAHQLAAMAKADGPAIILVGHVTKEGVLAGPRVLEHLVDTVLSFEGDRHHALRLLRAVKHRFGPTGELGLFEMTGRGLEGVVDPAGMFLADRWVGSPGSVVFPSIEGQRPLLVEVQALVVASQMVNPRRSAAGFDSGRLALLLAVLDQRAGLRLAGHDVYISAVGGVRVVDPGADLAVCLALASAITGVPVADDVVVLGEVGLAGEVRQVSQTPRRLAEAARLGFSSAVVPDRGPEEGPVRLCRVRTLCDALGLQLGPSTAGSGWRARPSRRAASSADEAVQPGRVGRSRDRPGPDRRGTAREALPVGLAGGTPPRRPD